MDDGNKNIRLHQVIEEILSSPFFREMRNRKNVMLYTESSVSMREMLERNKNVRAKSQIHHKKRKKRK